MGLLWKNEPSACSVPSHTRDALLTLLDNGTTRPAEVKERVEGGGKGCYICHLHI